MNDLIRRLALWVNLIFRPGPGVHRRAAHPRPGAAPAPAAPRAARPRLPLARSPYAVPDEVLDGAAMAIVRPYVVAHERECARRRRRLALVLAADFGVDLDVHLIGADAVAAGPRVGARSDWKAAA
jgi:hypothetical protein